jgi:hypothetical protein
MDSTIHIKNNLISRIRDSKDLNFLRALQTIFDSSEQELFQLNKTQTESIKESRKQVKKGNYTKNSQAISEIREWLEKK